MSAERVALDHYRARQGLVRAASVEAARLWRQVDSGRIVASWRALVPRLLLVLVGAQTAAARAADGYVDEVLTEQGVDPQAVGRVEAASFAGVASDGRDLDELLLSPAFGVLSTIGQGAAVGRAVAGGAAALDMVVRTQVADAGRTADQVALVARPDATGYVRMLVGRTCSRCAILAGRRYLWSAGFDRHPRCDCVHIPCREDTADDLRTNPKAYFASLTEAEQDRLFTKAGAEAIRNGADPARVVNARRGMYEAGGRLFTREATTRRGRLPGQTRGPRLMPEQILREAGDDRGEATRLLRLHGYLI